MIRLPSLFVGAGISILFYVPLVIAQCPEGGGEVCSAQSQGTCFDGVTNQDETCADVGGVCGRVLTRELNCEDGLDNDCDGKTDQRDPGCPAKNIVIWHHSYGESSSNIKNLAASGFVTHVMIGNLDFNEQPISQNKYKIQTIKKYGLIPIWERDLWFQDGDTSQAAFAQPFRAGYTDGSILLNTNYYASFLRKLTQEALQLGVELVAVDVEPHVLPNDMRGFIHGPEDFEQRKLWYANVRKAAKSALRLSGVKQADYVVPTNMFIREFNGYQALTGLGINKIATNTYFDCPARLTWSEDQQFDIIGAWVTTKSSCYRQGYSCKLSNYGQVCPWTQGTSNTALWGISAIFENEPYWYSKNRGLFLYGANSSFAADDTRFPVALKTYCYFNRAICDQYGE